MLCRVISLFVSGEVAFFYIFIYIFFIQYHKRSQEKVIAQDNDFWFLKHISIFSFTQAVPESSDSMFSSIFMLENIWYNNFIQSGPNSQEIMDFVPT